MESYGIPTGDLDSLNEEFFENSRQNQTSEELKAILQGISGKPAVLSNSKPNKEQNVDRRRSASPKRNFSTLVKNRNTINQMNQRQNVEYTSLLGSRCNNLEVQTPSYENSSSEPSTEIATATLILHSVNGGQCFTTRRIEITDNGPEIFIGRKLNGKVHDLVTSAIFDCPVVSRKHAVIWYKDSVLWLYDSNSANGTFLNGNQKSIEPLKRIVISTGDIIQFGQNVIDMASKESKCIIAKVELIPNSSNDSSESGFITGTLDQVDNNDNKEGNIKSILQRISKIEPANPTTNPTRRRSFVDLRSSPRNSPSISPRPFSRFTVRKTVPDIIIDSHDQEEELKKVREILSGLEATEDSVQEKMVRVRETLQRVSEEVKLSWNSQVKEDLLLDRIQTLEDKLQSKPEEKSQIAKFMQKLTQLEAKTDNLANSQKTLLSLNIYLSLFLSILLIAFFIYTEVFLARRKTLTVW